MRTFARAWRRAPAKATGWAIMAHPGEVRERKGATLPDDETFTWFRICERRYSLRGRSKLTDTSAREQAFDAAMVQFEEMFKAAGTVTEFTRPVQLYYGLAQAAWQSPQRSRRTHGASAATGSSSITGTLRLQP